MHGLTIPDRYEVKYVLPVERLDELRASIRPFCELDEHSAAAPDRHYAIRSIYFDTPGHRLYRHAREGRAERFKVRARRYGPAGGEPGGPVFLEVKRKSGAFVRKTRATVPFDGWLERLAAPPSPGVTRPELVFRAALDGHRLEPVLLQRYEREAWFSRIDGYARVTLDRHMECQPARGWSFDADPGAWLALDHRETMHGARRAVLLELKCTPDVPRWMLGVIDRLGLCRTGFSKYCCGIERVWGHASLETSFALAAGVLR